jgi:photosystem II stability/assembly factor-like uncharacterized protein
VRNLAWFIVLCLACLGACHSKNAGSGVDWRNKGPDEDPPSPIRDVAFSGADLCWVLTGSGDLLRSRDGGETWDTISGESVDTFDRLCFIDDANGWALSSGFRGTAREYESGPPGLVASRIFRTNNGGSTWTALAQLTKAEVERAGGPHAITFADETHGWLTSLSGAWRTTDGGRSWGWYAYPRAADSLDATGYVCQFTNADTGWLDTQDGCVYKSTDGGQTWEPLGPLDPPSRTGRPNITTFLDDTLTGLMISSDERLYRTEDGGHSWHQDPGIDPTVIPESVDVVNQQDAWLVASVHAKRRHSGEPEYILVHTADSGRSWKQWAPPESGLTLLRVYFADSRSGWLHAVQVSDGGQLSKLYRTSDGGSNWRPVLSLTGLGDRSQ